VATAFVFPASTFLRLDEEGSGACHLTGYFREKAEWHGRTRLFRFTTGRSDHTQMISKTGLISGPVTPRQILEKASIRLGYEIRLGGSPFSCIEEGWTTTSKRVPFTRRLPRSWNSKSISSLWPISIPLRSFNRRRIGAILLRIVGERGVPISEIMPIIRQFMGRYHPAAARFPVMISLASMTIMPSRFSGS
jgi:hypothetical protein